MYTRMIGEVEYEYLIHLHTHGRPRTCVLSLISFSLICTSIHAIQVNVDLQTLPNLVPLPILRAPMYHSSKLTPP